MKPETRDHVVAATHFVLGPSNFLVLPLPSNWDLRLGRTPMDIDYTVFFEGVRWAQAGQASAMLVDAKAKRAIELTVRTTRGSIAPPKLVDPRPGRCRVGTHEAAYEIGGANLGLFGTKHYVVLHVAYRCEETQRLVDLRFMHKGPTETLEGLLPSLERARCH
ncbi:MAG: hypothetical protein E6K19_06840 [Methanobacteriota archaeon]|nr:MAG: hypothetical protein E6K19_06840 [Euryarchaeota archaeon]